MTALIANDACMLYACLVFKAIIGRAQGKYCIQSPACRAAAVEKKAITVATIPVPVATENDLHRKLTHC